MKKTNAMRILETAKIAYETKEYADDGEHELERGAAEELAKKLLEAYDISFLFFKEVLNLEEEEARINRNEGRNKRDSSILSECNSRNKPKKSPYSSGCKRSYTCKAE